MGTARVSCPVEVRAWIACGGRPQVRRVPLLFLKIKNTFLQKEFNYKPQAEAATAPPSISCAAAAAAVDRQPPAADRRPPTADCRPSIVGRRGRGRGRGRVVSAPRVTHDAATRRMTSHRRARRGATLARGGDGHGRDRDRDRECRRPEPERRVPVPVDGARDLGHGRGRGRPRPTRDVAPRRVRARSDDITDREREGDEEAKEEEEEKRRRRPSRNSCERPQDNTRRKRTFSSEPPRDLGRGVARCSRSRRWPCPPPVGT